MDATFDIPEMSEQQLEYFVDIVRQSGKYQILPVESTPSPPILTREDVNTPEREYIERHRNDDQGNTMPKSDCEPSNIFSPSNPFTPLVARASTVNVSSPSNPFTVDNPFTATSTGKQSAVNPMMNRQLFCPGAASGRPSYYSGRGQYVMSNPLDNNPVNSMPAPSNIPAFRDSLYPYSFQQPVHYSNSRIPKLPEFSGEGKDGGDFEMWKYDVNCLIRNAVYPQHVILEAIRKSLKGKARTVLLHLGEGASVSDIIEELDGIYGNVATVEKLKEKFYCAQQESSESVADYSLRLEQLLCKSNVQLNKTTKNEMLCNRLWSGLRDTELRNVSRYKFENIHDYGVLRREIRQIEQDLQATKKNTVTPSTAGPKQNQTDKRGDENSTPSKSKVEPVTQCMSSVENKLLQQLQDLTNQMRQMNARVGEVEKEIQSLKRASNRQNVSSDRRRWSDRNKHRDNTQSRT